MIDTAYTIENLEFSYNSRQGSGQNDLKIPRLEIEKAKVTVIRGHNGSGKTTLLKLIASLLKAQQGQIRPSGDLRAVLVQQEPYLFHSTVQQNLMAPLRFAGLSSKGQEGLIRETLAELGLQGFEKRKARELSGGEKKRVAIARALICKPHTLLLDEPDANVDHKTSQELELLIQKLRDRGMTIILCSHHRAFAYRCSDTIVDLYQGQIINHDENVFKGEYIHNEGHYSRFICGDLSLRCPSSLEDFTTLVLSAENVSLSRECPENDMENCLKGTIEKIERYKEDRYTICLNTGQKKIKTRMSGSILNMLNYEIGEEVNILFNPSSLRLY